MNPSPIIVREKPTYLVGMSSPLPPRSAPPQERPRVIRELSRAFLSKVSEIKGRKGPERYSVIENDIHESGKAPVIRVMVAVDSFEAIPTWCDRFTIEPGHYAVFEHKGLPSELSRTVADIHAKWSKQLPGLFESDREIILYPAGYDPTDLNGVFEYCLPLP